jgi:hypothetical protein
LTSALVGEVKEFVLKMKNKASGHNVIPAEIWKIFNIRRDGIEPQKMCVIKRNMGENFHRSGRLLFCTQLTSVPRHGASSGCGWRRRPPDIEDC